MEATSGVRRGIRVAKQVPITIRWQPPGRDVEEDPGKTLLLSKHGCSLTCRVPLNVGGQVWVLDPARHKGGNARVVFRELAASAEEFKVAVEFLGTDDFWEMCFFD